MINNFVGLFIMFLPRVVLFSVATLYIACVAGILRRGKGERRAREDRGTFSLLCSFSLSSLPFYGLPRRLLCIMLLLPQNMFLDVSSFVTMTTRCRKVDDCWCDEEKNPLLLLCSYFFVFWDLFGFCFKA